MLWNLYSKNYYTLLIGILLTINSQSYGSIENNQDLRNLVPEAGYYRDNYDTVKPLLTNPMNYQERNRQNWLSNSEANKYWYTSHNEHSNIQKNHCKKFRKRKNSKFTRTDNINNPIHPLSSHKAPNQEPLHNSKEVGNSVPSPIIISQNENTKTPGESLNGKSQQPELNSLNPEKKENQGNPDDKEKDKPKTDSDLTMQNKKEPCKSNFIICFFKKLF